MDSKIVDCTRHGSEPGEEGPIICKCMKIPSIHLCRCLKSPSEKSELPLRKEYVLNIVGRTEDYLQTRRIPELMRFIMTKLLVSGTDMPVHYIEQLLNECMLFRAGLGPAPVLYERRHLQAILKSFDPSNRGWLSAVQVRRVFATLRLPLKEIFEDKVATDSVLLELERVQEKELYELVCAGTVKNPTSTEPKTSVG